MATVRWFLGSLGITLASGIALAGPDIDELLAKHRSAHEAIGSLHAVVEVRHEQYLPQKMPPQQMKCDWWQDGPSVRYTLTVDEDLRGGVKAKLDHTRSEGLTDGAKSRTAYSGSLKQSGAKATVGTVDDPAFEQTLYSPWTIGLYLCWNRPNNFYDIALARRGAVANVAMRTEKGMPVVSFDQYELRSEVAFDPSVNYLVRRRATWPVATGPAGGGELLQEVVKEFREVSPGIYFPTRVETRTYRDERLLTQSISVVDIKMVNGRVPDGTMALEFPAGATVFDYNDQVVYRTGKDGGRVDVRPLGAFLYGGNAVAARRWHVYLGGGLMAVALALLAIIVRRRAIARSRG